MSKQDVIEVEGIVKEALPNATFQVEIPGGHMILAHISGKLRMNYLPSDAVLRNNDQVVTTGSTVYPKGLILGYVEDAGFDETGVAKYAMLRPAADLEDLEQVFVITDYVSE